MTDLRILAKSERDIPLAVKYETRGVWREAKAMFGVDATGAAIAVALHDARSGGSGVVSYSRSRNFYDGRATHPLLSYRKTLRAVDRLEAGGFIEHFRQVPGGRGWQSAMAATDTLFDAVAALIGDAELALLPPRWPVQLRADDGTPIALPRSRAISRLCKSAEAINEAIMPLDVRSPDGVRLSAPVVRIFNGDMGHGGRFYGVGASWQTVKREVRKAISIHGEPVVELDYATMHPALLYAEAGAPLSGDCYEIGRWPRALVKLAVLILINADTLPRARWALAFDDVMVAHYPGDDQSRLSLASALIADVKKRHRPIAQFFHSGAGLRLQRKDSEIANAVQMHLLKRGIVALPMHDSFLVTERHRSALEASMMEVAGAFGLPDLAVS